MYFVEINSPRRFRLINDPIGQVFAIYDQGRAYTIYAPVGSRDGKTVEFVGEPRSYWDDEVEEVR